VKNKYLNEKIDDEKEGMLVRREEEGRVVTSEEIKEMVVWVKYKF
jgi:predicted transcriptional regulator